MRTATATTDADAAERARHPSTRHPATGHPTTGALALLAALATAKLLLHLAAVGSGSYGIFRDELYYLACADHLSWGFVDHPPLSIAVLAAWRALVGDSLVALRVAPALAGAATVLVTGLLARELGGGRFAQGVAALASLVSLIHLGYGAVYSMNAFDLLLVALALLWLARLIRRGGRHHWLLLGATLGLALANKVGALWVCLGVAVAVLASRERRWLATRSPWLGAGLAALLFLPYLLWNAAHGWPHLEFIARARELKYAGVGRGDFVLGQLLLQNPVALPVWAGGLGWLLAAPAARRWRPLGLVWLTAFGVLLAAGHSKPEYLASVFPALQAAGGVAWERWLAAPGRHRLRPAFAGLLVAGLALAPLALPILPVPAYVAYADALGVAPGTAEGHELGALPQFYADMFGWREKAEAVAEVFHGLPPDERARAAIFATNYGRAGAVDRFGPELGLPPALSGHNSYWLWGPGDADGDVVIVLGGERENLAEVFDRVELAGRATCELCIPYENDVPIWVCRGLRMPMAELWPGVKELI